MTRFNCDYADVGGINSPHLWTQYGLKWELSEYGKLRELCNSGAGLQAMSHALQRPPSGVVAKLVQLELIKRDLNGYYVYVKPSGSTALPVTVINHTPVSLEVTMNHNKAEPHVPTIETKVMIHGRDASGMSDGEIFALIGKLEREIEGMLKIEAKPKKLLAAVEVLRADIAKLVTYVDERE